MPYSYDEDLIREIRESNDIVGVISDYVELKRAGSDLKGLCPFHSEKTPSMVVSSSKQMFHCFGCGEGGDVISFIMKYKNIDFKQAIEELADRANIQLKKKTDQDLKRDREKQLLYKINREAAIYYYKKFSSLQEPQNYLDNRGITKETMRKFGIGYAVDSWNGLLNYLLKRAYKIEDIEKTGLIIKHRERNSHYDRFRDRVMFPIWDISSNIIGFGGRLLDENKKQPKYLNSPDTEIFLKGKNLYGLNFVKDSIRGSRIILVEGYMDVISMYQNGIGNSVASLGTALTREQVKLIKRYTNDIAIAYDYDDAGINATQKAIDIIKKEGLTPRVVTLEEGMDPDDFVNRYGVETLKERIETADHYIEFMIKLKSKANDMNSIEGRLQFARDMKPYIEDIKSPVELDIYISKIADIAKVDRESLKREIGLYKNKARYRNNVDSNKQIVVPRAEKKSEEKMELEFLKLLIDKKDVTILSDINLEEFKDLDNRKLLENFKENKSLEILDMNLDDNLKVHLEKIVGLNISFSGKNLDKAIKDYRKKLNIRYLKSKKESILKKIREYENQSEISSSENIRELCQQLTDIDRAMRRS